MKSLKKKSYQLLFKVCKFKQEINTYLASAILDLDTMLVFYKSKQNLFEYCHMKKRNERVWYKKKGLCQLCYLTDECFQRHGLVN